jgi:glucose-6-phosphate isomerase
MANPTTDPKELWARYKKMLCDCPSVGFRVDPSRVQLDDDALAALAKPMEEAFAAMDALEKGAIANPDEKRMVGHYWLRDPSRAPTPELRQAIETTDARIKTFAAEVHAGTIKPATAARFTDLCVIGIGGSALGPELCAAALTQAGGDRMVPHFVDNTDPDGIDRLLGQIGDALPRTLTVVISKSGGTKETRNGMLELAAAYQKRGLTFAQHAVAVTGDGSELDQYAVKQGFLARFPMWDWVGGRTSELSAVGLLPAALQGVDIDAFLAGARAMDEVTRVRDLRKNPAALLAAVWHRATSGKGAKDMVVLPYKDRLELFSRYLQQLVMESLGKEKDLDGKVVHQGIAVYGNKGSTDQHAYVQQLRDGVANFFVTFIDVLADRRSDSIEVEPGVTSGDFLAGFLYGTRRALWESGRESVTITIPDVSPSSLGALIALYERTVGFYATLVHINAYHQPGVEAGKKAAAAVIAVQGKVLAALAASREPRTAEDVARAAGLESETETVFYVLEHLAHSSHHKLRRTPGATPFDARYVLS